VAAKWQASLKQLRRVQRECGWNAEYLRVVEEPLARLTSKEAAGAQGLAAVVRTLLRSLHQIFITTAYFKEQRMAPLLHRVLKALVAQARESLPPLHEVAAPACGFRRALEVAGELRGAFQAYIDSFFIAEAAGGLQGDRRPATAMGSRADRSMSASALRRKDAADLGFWRATVRHSLEHAEHCRQFCGRAEALLRGAAGLRAALPALRAAGPQLLQAAESFVQVHSGLAPGLSTEELLDMRQRPVACARLQEVEERLRGLLADAEAAGIAVASGEEAVDALEAAAAAAGPEDPLPPPRFLAAAGAGAGAGGAETAEVLTLPSGDCGDGNRPPLEVAQDLQAGLDALREQFQSLGAELECLGETVSRRPTPRMRFAPRPRTGGAPASAAAATSGCPPEAPGEDDAAERAVALEVARRASWWREPPPVLAPGVELLQVHQRITQTTIHRCPSRPRTAQPVLFVTRPPEPEVPPEPECEGPSPAGSGGEPATEEEAAGPAEAEEAPGPEEPGSELGPCCDAAVAWRVA